MKNTLNDNPTAMIPIANIHPFEGHPYQVRDDEEMAALTESVRDHGILSPLILRPLENTENEYELISGHRRFRAAQTAGMKEVPAVVVSVTREEAAIMLVDSNLHREHILPSEKAFAYKLKMDAISHQGQACGQVGHKSRDSISDIESGRQIQRYIRLTYLIPEIMKQLDEGNMALSVGVELSYLDHTLQETVFNICQELDCSPSYSQSSRMRKLFSVHALQGENIRDILSEEKANQKERLRIPMDRIRKFFPQHYSPAQIEDSIVKLCETQYRRRMSRER